MRIALLALHFAEYASRLALALARKHEVLLVLCSGNARDDLPDDLRALLRERVSVRLIELPRLRDPRLVRTVLSINRVIRDFSPDILHVQEQHPAYTGWARLSFRRRMPVVLEIHDHVPHSGAEFYGGWRWQLVQWFRAKASRVIVHGPRIRSELEQLNARLAGRIDDIPHGILGRDSIDEDISGYEPGTFLFFGRIESYNDKKQMAHPDYIVAPEARDDLPMLEPVYPLTAGLSGKVLLKAGRAAVERMPALPEWQEPSWLKERAWPDVQTAVARLHRPQDAGDVSTGSPPWPCAGPSPPTTSSTTPVRTRARWWRTSSRWSRREISTIGTAATRASTSTSRCSRFTSAGC